MEAEGEFNRTGTVTVDGAELAYREQGEGVPIVFVHGDLSDLRTWVHQVEGLSDSFRVIAYSRRYARPNEDIVPGADNPVGPHVRDLAELISGLGAAPAHLVGSSWGGLVCLLLASRHPELVRSLVLEEPPALTLFVSPKPRIREIAALLARRPRAAATIMKFGVTVIAPTEKAFSQDRDEQAMWTFVEGVIGRKRFEAAGEGRTAQARENRSAAKAGMLGSGLPVLEDADVRGVEADVLLLNGEHSPAVFGLLTDRLAALLPRSERAMIPGAGHNMHEDEPEAVNLRISEFVAAR